MNDRRFNMLITVCTYFNYIILVFYTSQLSTVTAAKDSAITECRSNNLRTRRLMGIPLVHTNAKALPWGKSKKAPNRHYG